MWARTGHFGAITRTTSRDRALERTLPPVLGLRHDGHLDAGAFGDPRARALERGDAFGIRMAMTRSL